MTYNLQEKKGDLAKAVEFFKNDISSLRTGRASTAMVEDLPVEVYGTKQSLKSTASINLADAKTINVEPWDKSLLADIEKAVRDSSLGVNPVNDGQIIRVILPELTSERRVELIKVLHQKQENARISLRKIREEIREDIAGKEKTKEISEDEKYKLQEDLDKMVKEYNDEVKEIGDKKEEEINKV